MVSFQCNGCGDVLTKPKLDKHRAMCHSSFDCIDCSKRFETPADYKGHTSCISEAEKYQKTLYNGEKQSGPERSDRNQRSQQQGGGRQRGNNRPQWQQRNVNKATGANDTPLGTPLRMSPVYDTPVVEEKSQPAVDTLKKRKAEAGTTESKDASEPTKKKKKWKNIEGEPETTEASAVKVKTGTKRKSTPEVTITEQPSSGFQLVEHGNSPKEVVEKKKSKKESKRKEVKENGKEEVKEKEKEKRKRREDPSSSRKRRGSGMIVDGGVTISVQSPATGVPSAIGEGEARPTKKKSKLKLKVATTDDAADVPAPARSPRPTTLEMARNNQGKEERQSVDGSLVAQGDDSSLKEKRKEKKSKKRKSACLSSGG